MKETLRIATRQSALALWQAKHIQQRLRDELDDVEIILVPMTSQGDKVLDRPLALIGGKGHFTKELEDAMLEGKADMAVHSLKDVPTLIPQGLSLSAVTRREDQSDVLLSYRYKSLDDLPKGAVVGTTSLRRRMQLLAKRPDLKIRNLRGNVNTRLQKLQEGQYDAIVLAKIGLQRLGLLRDIPFVDHLHFMIPPMGQAALGIEIVASHPLAQKACAILNDTDTYRASQAERAFISRIGAGCSAPVAVHATIEDEHIRMEAMIGLPDGTQILSHTLTLQDNDPENVGSLLAKEMIAQGALELLEKAEATAFKQDRIERL